MAGPFDTSDNDPDNVQIETGASFELSGRYGIDEMSSFEDPDNPDLDAGEVREAGASTAHIMEQARLYGATPGPDDPDTREVYDPEDAHDAIDQVMDLIATRIAPDGSPLEPDRTQLMWGIVHVLNAQAERLFRAASNLEPEIRDLQKAQDGNEISSLQLQRATERGWDLQGRAEAFERMRNTAAAGYQDHTGQIWRVREPRASTTSRSERHESPRLAMKDYTRARNYLARTAGTRVAIVSGLKPGRALVWATLDRLYKQHPDLVVIHGANSRGADAIAREWAIANDVPMKAVAPDYKNHEGDAALKERNDRIAAEKPDGLVIFPGAGRGVPADLVSKIADAGIPITRIENTAQLTDALKPLLAGYRLEPGALAGAQEPNEDPNRSHDRTLNAATAAGAFQDTETAGSAFTLAVQMLIHRVTPDGYQVADERENMLWGVANVIATQLKRVETELQQVRNDPDIPPAQRDAVAGEIEVRKETFSTLFEQAKAIYRDETLKPWQEQSFGRSRDVTSAALLESQSFLNHVDRRLHEAHYREGAVVAVAGDKIAPEVQDLHYAAVARTLDAVHEKYPDMKLAHWGNENGYDRLAAAWADANNVPQIPCLPDFSKHGKQAAPYERNSEMFRELQPKGVIAFGPAAGKLVVDMIEKAGRLNVGVMKVDPAQDHSFKAASPDPATVQETRQAIATRYTDLIAAAGQQAEQLPYQKGFEDFRQLVNDTLGAGHQPEQFATRLEGLRETLDRHAECRDTVQHIAGRLDDACDRLDGLKEWAAENPGRAIETAPGFNTWLRDRDQALGAWNEARQNPDLESHLPLAPKEMVPNAERLEAPGLPTLFHDAALGRSDHASPEPVATSLERVSDLYRQTLDLVDRKAELLPYAPQFQELRATVQEAATACAGDPARSERLEALSAQLAGSEERMSEIQSTALNMSQACVKVLGFEQWSRDNARPVHEAPEFPAWRANADSLLERFDTQRNDPVLAPHLEHCSAARQANEQAAALLRDERFKAPVVPEVHAAAEQTRTRTVQQGASRAMSA